MRSTPLGEEKDANLARDEETGEVRKIRGEIYIYIYIDRNFSNQRSDKYRC